MAIARSNRSKGFWFGTERKMGWFPTPNRGADMSPEGWGESGVLLNGGGYNFSSFGSHKNYQFEWPGSSAREVAQLMKAYADGTYGRGLIYFQDCLMFETNVLPARVADPSMTIGYEGTSLVHGVEPTAVPQSSGVNNLPVYGARYDLNRAYVGFRKGGGAVFVPIPEGFTLNLAALYEASGTAGVFYSPQDSQGNVSPAVKVPPVDPSVGLLSSIIVPGGASVAGVWLWAGRNSSGPGTLTIQAMSARLIETEVFNRIVGTPELYTHPVFSGPWQPGQGHSGCRFEGKPTFIANGPFNGGHVGFAASFREVGSWTNG